jgi:hypothetical protein
MQVRTDSIRPEILVHADFCHRSRFGRDQHQIKCRVLTPALLLDEHRGPRNNRAAEGMKRVCIKVTAAHPPSHYSRYR